MKTKDEKWQDQTCTCIAINHPLHKKGECDEPPTQRGGICNTCRYWYSHPAPVKETK